MDETWAASKVAVTDVGSVDSLAAELVATMADLMGYVKVGLKDMQSVEW